MTSANIAVPLEHDAILVSLVYLLRKYEVLCCLHNNLVVGGVIPS